jgi:superfamily II DNA or RNA helicase
MWLDISNLRTKVLRATEEEKTWLRGYLSFEDPRARFHGHGDGYVRMYNVLNDTFPSGFVPMVKKAAIPEGIQIELVDHRQPPCHLDLTADLGWLRDYQQDAVNRVLNRGRGILWCPTGSGKTEIAIALTKSLPCKWLFLVHRSSLMKQAAERYETRCQTHAGRIGDGVWEPRDRFTVATFQTLHARLMQPEAKFLLANIGGLIVDEAHTLPADSFWKVAMSINAYYRIGLSGTPLARGDRRSLLTIAATGPVIYRIRPEVLIQAGVLARPKIRMLTVTQTSIRPTWQGVYGECIVRSVPRNKVVLQAVRRSAKPCLVFVKEIAHGKGLAKVFQQVGIPCDFVWGSDSTDRRRAAVHKLIRGDIEVLICSVIFQEGIDIPALQSVVIASGGQSVIAALQRIGRGMRMAQGKDEFEVYDIADRGNKWLERHTRERLKAYAGEGFETVIEP